MTGYRILCARPGFRRAGIAHPESATYAPGELSDEQIEQLRAEPLITVIEVDGAGADLAPEPARKDRGKPRLSDPRAGGSQAPD